MKHLLNTSTLGPFICNPFNTNCVISFLLCVPRRGSNELHIVHDLSYPEGCSVNGGVSKDQFSRSVFFFKLRSPGIDRVSRINFCWVYTLLALCNFTPSYRLVLRSATMIFQPTTKKCCLQFRQSRHFR